MSNTIHTTRKAAAMLMTVIAGVLGLLLFTTNPAGALPIAEPVPTPEPPKPELLIPQVFELVLPTGSVDVSCTTETATATFGNKSNDYYDMAIEVDGSTIKSGTVGPNQQMTATFDLAENTTKHVKIGTFFDDDVTRDCLHPDTSYQVMSNCDTGQAHARLVNNGDDTAQMAVSYPGDANALQPVGPHTSFDWLLEVAPNESVDFAVHDSTGQIGGESLTFICADPETNGEGEGAGEEEGEGAGEEEGSGEEEGAGEEEGPGEEEQIIPPPPPPTPVTTVPAPTTPPAPTTAAGQTTGPATETNPAPTTAVVDDFDDGETDVLGVAIDAQDLDELGSAEASASAADTSETGTSGRSFDVKRIVFVLWGFVLVAAAMVALVAWRRRTDVAHS